METIFTNENLYSILSGRTHSVFNRALLNNFRKNNISLTKEQWTILGVLWQNDGCSQQTLADKTYRDKPGITRLVDNLEKENLVERRPDAKDRRLNLIFLTPKGKIIEKEVIEIVNQTLEDAIKGIDLENLKIVRDTFLQIYDNLELKIK
ncbi:MarR family winged helix-turn-helix transcriptional regulator [Flavobacterium sp.]|uniref:MarR family winged helix-turn-helix transcriptional regulator n=1 Tax=Flavobacterium sp. TaxID=239 RepID=UPI00375052C7